MKAIIKKYLEINNYKNECNDFENLFLSHPNYPSLYAVTDTFDLLQIENVAAKVPKEQFTELPNSFLAIVSDDIVLVAKENTSMTIEKEKVGKKKVLINDFLNDWNGIVIAIDTKNIPKNKTAINFFKNKYIVLVVLLLLLVMVQFEKLDWLFLLNFSFSLIGFLLSVFIIDEKINKTDGVVSKICSFSEKTSCDSVIKSNDAKITNWLDFSDLPIVFFAISILMIVFNLNSFLVINLASVFSLPIIAYSIWLQKVKLKKWCILCLGVSFVLISQSVLFFVFGKQILFDYSSIIIPILLVISLWIFIRPIVFSTVILKKNNLDLIKFKRNFSIFNSLCKDVIDEEKLNSLQKIEIGSNEATITLGLIVSPSCGHCHTAFKEGLQLQKLNPIKLKLEVFFNLNPDNGENPYFSIAENLLQINKDCPEKIEEALSDWHIKNMDLYQWKLKWKQKDIEYTIEKALRRQYEWCLINELNYTPVKLINNKLFPSEYTIEELKYFLSELEDELKPQMV